MVINRTAASPAERMIFNMLSPEMVVSVRKLTRAPPAPALQALTGAPLAQPDRLRNAASILRMQLSRERAPFTWEATP
jgi:hypothetical protein